MDRKLTPERVAKEYDAAIRFNSGIDLYNCVQTNENFFIGKQWEGVQSNGLPTPVFNFLKRVVLFSVANVSTDNLKLNAIPLASNGGESAHAIELLTGILNDEFASIFERNKLGSKIREFCRNAAVDGDGCLYVYWDETEETGQAAKGAVQTEVLLNTQVLFGNPNNRAVQSQPYILIERRMLLSEARKHAKRNGVENEIVADGKESGNTHLDELGGEKVTVLLRLWRDDDTGTIHGYECTKRVELRKEWDLGISVYPLVWMNWDYIQDCYHGQAMITGLIPNQIFINKLFAMSMISLMTLAYPKVVYDKTKIAKWSNRVGSSIGVSGSVENVAKIIDPASISPQISQFIELAVSYTQKFLGATDVALGDTRPDNTSAIIALQRAAATPMELTKQNLLQSVEDLGIIYVAFMIEYYGQRMVNVELEGQRMAIPFDFEKMKNVHCKVDLEAGATSYWSEIAAMQTMDNLLMQGKIDTIEYLKRLPAGQITDRDALISAMEKERQMQMQVAGMTPASPTQAPEAPPVLRGGPGNAALQRKINETGEVPEQVVM